MAARTDFDFLLSIAYAEADRAVLERITADRERLLAGEWLPEPGERLELRLLPEGSRPLTLDLRSDMAPASLDTLVELLRDGAHMKLAGFRGETGGTVLDIGANEGFYALLLKRHNPDTRLIAVEPLAEHVELIHRNVALNDIHGVEVHQTAVTASDEPTVTLETYPSVGTVSSRALESFPRPWITPELIRRRTVPSVSLRALLDEAGVREAALLKIDTEGSETEILTGHREVLRRFARVVVECHGRESRRLCSDALANAGFDCLYAEPQETGDLYFERLG
jgi:FkbM family methyltransferase